MLWYYVQTNIHTIYICSYMYSTYMTYIYICFIYIYNKKQVELLTSSFFKVIQKNVTQQFIKPNFIVDKKMKKSIT